MMINRIYRLDLVGLAVFELMHFKCLVFVALIALCKQHFATRKKNGTQLKVNCNKNIALTIGLSSYDKKKM